MTNDFDKLLWESAIESQSLRDALVKTEARKQGRFQIPTLRVSALTGEAEDIHTTIFEFEAPEDVKERLIKEIQTVDNLTVKSITKLLNATRISILLKELKGEPLSEVDNTLKNLDFSLLCLIIAKYTSKTFGRKTPIKPPEEQPEGGENV